MATPPLAAMMARQLIGKLAGGGAPAGPGGPLPPNPAMVGQAGPGAGGPDAGAGGAASGSAAAATPAGLQLSQQLAELQNADPEAMTKSLTSIKGMIVSLYTRAVFTIPGVSRNLAQVVKYLDNSIQESEKAAATTAAASPIANNAAIPNPVGQQGLGAVSGLQSQAG